MKAFVISCDRYTNEEIKDAIRAAQKNGYTATKAFVFTGSNKSTIPIFNISTLLSTLQDHDAMIMTGESNDDARLAYAVVTARMMGIPCLIYDAESQRINPFPLNVDIKINIGSDIDLIEEPCLYAKVPNL